MTNLAFYGSLLGGIKTRIRQAQTRAARDLYQEYPQLFAIGQPPVAQLGPRIDEAPIVQQAVAQLSPNEKMRSVIARIPWAHDIRLIQMAKGLAARQRCARQVLFLALEELFHEREPETGLVRHGDVPDRRA